MKWTELIRSVTECDLCSAWILDEESQSHAEGHADTFLHPRTLSFSIEDPQYLRPLPQIIYVCPLCGIVPPAFFSVTDGTKAIHQHLLDIHRPPDGSPPHISFTSIRNPDRIAELVRMVETGQEVTLLQCKECDELLLSMQDGVNHFVHSHQMQKKITRRDIEKRQRSGNTTLSQKLVDALATIAEVPKMIEEPPVEQEGHKRIPLTETPTIREGPLKRTTRSQDDPPKKRKLRRRARSVPVPHKRSILKKLAGIDDEASWPPARKEPRTESERIEDEHLAPIISKLKIEASYLNIAEGTLNWSKVSKFVDDDCTEVTIRTDDGRAFQATRDAETGVVTTRNGELLNWFLSNNLRAGCHLYLSRTEIENEVEIAFNPIPTQVKRCLLAEWNDEEQRVQLKYEDITVEFECSEHLFRSSINLSDLGILEQMARLYGSIFDVLYLGMRDLDDEGHDVVHYRDLHNMVLDKRLHPQLGSIFVELSKNPTQFERMGGGYWRLIRDERIERILGRLLRPKIAIETETQPLPPEPVDEPEDHPPLDPMIAPIELPEATEVPPDNPQNNPPIEPALNATVAVVDDSPSMSFLLRIGEAVRQFWKQIKELFGRAR